MTRRERRPEGRADRAGDAPRVKICGLRRRADVLAAARAGADYVGFVFADSPRRVTPEGAARLVEALEEGEAPVDGREGTGVRGEGPEGKGRSPGPGSGRGGPRAVGVFVDASAGEVREKAGRVGLDVAQLHGDEPPEACLALREAGLEVWKAIRPRSREELRRRARRYRKAADALLVEGFSPEAAGGTGTAAPREWLASLAGDDSLPLVLAGGLTPENVAEAVRDVRPAVVDVSSGVERGAGEKDPDRIRAFVRAVRGASAPPAGLQAGR